VVHVNVSAYIALADTKANWQHGAAQCLSRKGLTGYDFHSVFKEGFIPGSVKPASVTKRPQGGVRRLGSA
jgi:hypothetical protein